MKKWRKTIGIAVLCVLVVISILPVHLAIGYLCSFEGTVERDEMDCWEIEEELHRGDKVKVVITKLRGNGELWVYFGRTEDLFCHQKSFTSPGEYTVTVPADGFYWLWMECSPYKKGVSVYYKGYTVPL